MSVRTNSAGEPLRETKDDLRTRLKREGRWRQFVNYRTELKTSGYTASAAHRAAATAFPPLVEGATGPVIKGDPPPPRIDNDGDDDGGGTPAPMLGELESDIQAGREIVERMAGERPLPGSGHEGGRQGAGAVRSCIPLFPRGEFGGDGKPVSPRQAVEWAFENLCVDDVKPGDAPSPGAWALLIGARQSGLSLKQFFDTWAKLLPTKTQIEQQDRFTDDGSVVLDLIDKVEARRVEPTEGAES